MRTCVTQATLGFCISLSSDRLLQSPAGARYPRGIRPNLQICPAWSVAESAWSSPDASKAGGNYCRVALEAAHCQHVPA